ncbi:MAG: hypothetical protein HOK41_02445 [Nitrospina sp.]|jgi:hypothetical protein|nr:hypothetical protein [Nitrospina sp.]
MPINFIYSDSLETDTTESFFSNHFLTARIDSNQPSNSNYDPILEDQRDSDWKNTHWQELKNNELNYEEDINQYITLSLAEMVNPKSVSNSSYLVNTSSDAGQLATRFENASDVYRVFRINADFLLFHLGLFSQNSNILGETYFDKGGAYYNSAASSLKRARGGSSGLSDVLEKLALKFGKYVEILRFMKNKSSNYFSFHFQYTKEEMEEFQNQLSIESQKRK